VNLASRITDYAGPGDVLVSQAVVDAVADAAALEPVGAAALKGVREPVTLYRAS